MKHEIIRLHAVTKAYQNTLAVEEISLAICQGELHAIIGLSDSGKTTISNLIQGKLKPDTGFIFVNEKQLSHYTPLIARNEGVFVIQAESSLVPEFSISDNLMGLRKVDHLFQVYPQREYVEKTIEVLNLFQVEVDPLEKAKNLTVATGHLIEVIKAACSDANLLILDDVMAAYSQYEAARLMGVLRSLKSRGMSILMISQQIRPELAYMDFVHVLKHHCILKTFRKNTFTHEQLRIMMINEAPRSYELSAVIDSAIVFEYKSHPKQLEKEISFAVSRGEIVGLHGLPEGVINQLIHDIMGEHQGWATMELNHEAYHPLSFYDASEKGVGYIPVNSDEKVIFNSMTVQENLFMTSYKKIANQLGILTKSRIRFAKNLLDESLNHQLSSADALGQQLPLVEKQKIVYQRYLLKKPKLLLCVKPTVTVDEASKHMVVDEIRRLSREGTAVVVIASDHDELHGLCHRMIHIT